MITSLAQKVEDAIREVAAEEVLPRFRRLRSQDMQEKSPGDWVTVADRAAEARLTPMLAALLPGSRVVGEESTAENPGLLQGLEQGEVWLIDPVDGTANFVAGDPCFGVMVALLREGQTIASWMHYPVSGSIAIAERGSGAWFDGQRQHLKQDTIDLSRARGIIKNRFQPPALRSQIDARRAQIGQLVHGTNCAAGDYAALVAGDPHFLLYWRTLPWDHAPGALYVQEAGGHAARLDGSIYRAGDGRVGLLSAANAALWIELRDALLRPTERYRGAQRIPPFENRAQTAGYAALLPPYDSQAMS